MTDKVQKIREEVEKIARSINPYIPDEEGKNSEYEAGKLDAATQILQIIDSLQEEPISEEIGNYNHTAVLEGLGYQSKEEPVSEDLEKFALQYAGHHAPYDSCMQEVEEAVKAGAKWQKEHNEFAR